MKKYLRIQSIGLYYDQLEENRKLQAKLAKMDQFKSLLAEINSKV